MSQSSKSFWKLWGCFGNDLINRKRWIMTKQSSYCLGCCCVCVCVCVCVLEHVCWIMTCVHTDSWVWVGCLCVWQTLSCNYSPIKVGPTTNTHTNTHTYTHKHTHTHTGAKTHTCTPTCPYSLPPPSPDTHAHFPTQTAGGTCCCVSSRHPAWVAARRKETLFGFSRAELIADNSWRGLSCV